VTPTRPTPFGAPLAETAVSFACSLTPVRPGVYLAAPLSCHSRDLYRPTAVSKSLVLSVTSRNELNKESADKDKRNIGC